MLKICNDFESQYRIKNKETPQNEYHVEEEKIAQGAINPLPPKKKRSTYALLALKHIVDLVEEGD